MNEKCEFCMNDKIETYITTIYFPFDDYPTFKGYICENCMDDIYYCETCERHIYYNNGYRINVRFDESDSVICVKCLHDKWFVEGMDNFYEADFFNDSDLLKHGFIKKYVKFCRIQDDYDWIKRDFNTLKESDNKVIVSIEADGMGLEHFIALWYKPLEVMEFRGKNFTENQW